MNKAALFIVTFLLGFTANYLLVIFFGAETFARASQGYGVKSYVETKNKLLELTEKVDTLQELLESAFDAPPSKESISGSSKETISNAEPIKEKKVQIKTSIVEETFSESIDTTTQHIGTEQ